jgi:outer membrane protein OmpA-like peptidoglycan-associated protein
MIIVLCLLAAVTVATSQTVVKEVETFDAAPRFWFMTAPESVPGFERSFSGGSMVLRKRSENVVWVYKSHPIDNTKDWSITARVIGRGSYMNGGPGIHVWAPDEQYIFRIAPAMKAFWVGSVDMNARQWTIYGLTRDRNNREVRNDAVRPDGDTNTLTVQRVGARLQFVINGVTVEDFDINAMGSIGRAATGLGVNVSQNTAVDVLDVSVNYTRPVFNVNPKAFVGSTKTYVENLNGDVSDRYAIVSPNGASLYFVRSSPVTGDDIWVAARETDSTWTRVRPIEGRLNNQWQNSVMAVSQDDNELFLWGKYGTFGEPAGFGFSKTRRTTDGWEIPTNVEIAGYTNTASTREECVSADRTVVIMAAQMDSTVGKKDLYVSFLQDDGTYSTPSNLGAALNSPFNEGMPYLAADNRTLYFGSSRPGYGDDDIWVSKRLDDTWRNWSEPVNMGPSVNTNAWDGYFSIHPSGMYAYVNSTDGVRNGIMRMRLPRSKESAKLLPDPTALISGRVINAKTNQPVATDVVIRDLTTNTKVATARSEPSQGRYSIVLPAGKSYGFFASEQGFYPVSDNLDLRKLKAFQEVKRELPLWPIEVGATVRLNNVFFSTGRAVVNTESRDELGRLIDLLKSRPTMRIEIGGHTDDRGSDEQNMVLSQNRANTVMTYLNAAGIQADRLVARGYGKTKPVSTARTQDALQRNRRVEFTIVGL